jgi:hypothetical protein
MGALLACEARGPTSDSGVYRPKGLMRKHLLAIAVILTVATGCDNVAWGGVDMELKPPPVSEANLAEDPNAAEGDGPVNLSGPLLLAGTRSGMRADFVVVGEVHPNTLREFPDPAFPEDLERLEQVLSVGSEWVLFSEGVRVGRMFADETRPATGFCGSRRVLSGVVELVPAAAAAERLLALPAEDARERAYGEYALVSHVYDQRVAVNTMASAAIREHDATRPPSVVNARGHVQAFQLPGAAGQSVAATFMYQDQLTIESPRQGAYSIFVIGRHQAGATYETTHSSYRLIESEGKGAQRYFDHLDWTGDGTDEVLLDVFGSNRRWFEALSERDGSWVRTFQDSCGAGPSTGN